MARALLMDHKVDPKQELLREVEPFLDDIDVLGAYLLVAIYKRPEKTASGIYMPGKARAEDEFQGKVGLVLKAGPTAFMEDETHHFTEAPVVGDWVLFNVGDTFGFELGERRCRFVEDVNVKAILKRPDIVW